MGQQPVRVRRVQARGRLIQHVQGVPAVAALQLGGQLDPLRLPAGQLRGRLAQTHIAQADVVEDLQGAAHLRHLVEELPGLGDRQVQDLGDVPPVPRDLQGLRVVAGAVAVRARRVDAGQEQQLDHDPPLPLAGGTASARHVEGEPAGLVPAAAGLVGAGEQAADPVEQARVRGHVGARRAPDGLLVDADDAAHPLDVAGHRAAGGLRVGLQQQGRLIRGLLGGLLRVGGTPGGGRPGAGQQLRQSLPDQGGLARPGDPGDGGQAAQGDPGVGSAQVVSVHPGQLEPPGGGPAWARGAGGVGGEVPAGHGLLRLRQARGLAAVQHAPAVGPRTGANVHEPVRGADDVQGVLDDEHAVPGRAQVSQDSQQGLPVPRVQAGGGLVQDVDDAEQLAGQLRGQAQPLQLPRGEGGGGPLRGEVAQAEVQDGAQPGQQIPDQAAGRGDLLRGEVGGGAHVSAAGVGRTARGHPGLDGGAASGLIGQGGGAGVLGGRGGPGVVEHGGQQVPQLVQGQRGDLGDVQALEGDGQRLGLDAPTAAGGAHGAGEVAGGALLGGGGLGPGEGVQHVAARTDEGPPVAGLRAVGLQPPHRVRALRVPVHGDGGALLGVEDPLPRVGGHVLPGHVDVVAEVHEDVPLVLPVPGAGPGRDGAVPDAQGGVRDHEVLGDVVDPADAVAFRAGTLRGVGREVLGVEHGLVRGVDPGAGVQHPQDVGQPGHRADAGAGGTAGAALLLQGHGRGHALDGVHLRDSRLVDEPPGVGRHGFQVAPLGFGEQRAEGQGGLPGPGDPGEHDDGVARDLQVHVAQVVLAGAAHAHDVGGSVGLVGGHVPCLPRRWGGAGGHGWRRGGEPWSRTVVAPPWTSSSGR